MDANPQPDFLDLYKSEPDAHSITACLLRHAITEKEIDAPMVIGLIDRVRPDPVSLRALGFAARQGIAVQQGRGEPIESARYACVLEKVELQLGSTTS